MDTAFNLAGVFDTYKSYYNDYNAKYPTTKDLEKAGVIDVDLLILG